MNRRAAWMVSVVLGVLGMAGTAPVAVASAASVTANLSLAQTATQAGSMESLGQDATFAYSSSGDSVKTITLTLPPGLLANAAIDGGQCLQTTILSSPCQVASGTVKATATVALLPVSVSVPVSLYLVPAPAPGDLAGIQIVANDPPLLTGPLGSPGDVVVQPPDAHVTITFNNVPGHRPGRRAVRADLRAGDPDHAEQHAPPHQMLRPAAVRPERHHVRWSNRGDEPADRRHRLFQARADPELQRRRHEGRYRRRHTSDDRPQAACPSQRALPSHRAQRCPDATPEGPEPQRACRPQRSLRQIRPIHGLHADRLGDIEVTAVSVAPHRQGLPRRLSVFAGPRHRLPAPVLGQPHGCVSISAPVRQRSRACRTFP